MARYEVVYLSARTRAAGGPADVMPVAEFTDIQQDELDIRAQRGGMLVGAVPNMDDGNVMGVWLYFEYLELEDVDGRTPHR